MNQGVIVFGAGGHAKVVISTLLAMDIPVERVIEVDPAKLGKTIMGLPIVPLDEDLDLEGRRGVIAVGDNARRKSIADEIPMIRWETAVHPRAYVHPSVSLGAGTVVFAGAIIQPDTIIGRHCIVNSNSSIDHDCMIGDYSHIGPGSCLAGEVSVDEGSFLGAGAVAIAGKKIGRWSVIGAGGVISRDIPDGVTAAGMPARVLRYHDDAGAGGVKG